MLIEQDRRIDFWLGTGTVLLLLGALLVIAGAALLAARDLRRYRDRDREIADRSEMLELAGDIAKIGHWRLTNPDALFWSDQIFRIYGLDPADGVPSLDAAIAAFAPEDRGRVAALVETALAKGEGWRYEAKLVRPNGEIIDVVSNAICAKDAAGKVTSVFGVFMDITHIRQSERSLAESERLYRLVSQNVNDSDRAYSEAIYEIAESVSSIHADEVDRDARFPAETIAAMREARLLSGLVPSSLGGGGVSLEAVAEGCYALGRHCSASAMVFAMHQIQVMMITRHLEGSPWFERYLTRVAAEQRLIASITSEQGTGGDMGRSIAALLPAGDGRFRFAKDALTISYGAHADDYLTTLRRADAASETDQVFVLHLGEETTLTAMGTWDTLGMRGTCSPGFAVEALIGGDQVLVDDVSTVVSETIPASYVLWSHVWLGIATAAFDRAHSFLRKAARRQPDATPPTGTALSRLSGELSTFRSNVRMGLLDFVALDRESMHLMPTVLRFNNLKITTADLAPRICFHALQIVGVSGYRNDSPFSVGRHLRDALSASLMVSNDRIHAIDATMLAIAKEV